MLFRRRDHCQRAEPLLLKAVPLTHSPLCKGKEVHTEPREGRAHHMPTAEPACPSRAALLPSDSLSSFARKPSRQEGCFCEVQTLSKRTSLAVVACEKLHFFPSGLSPAQLCLVWGPVQRRPVVLVCVPAEAHPEAVTRGPVDYL